MRFATFLVGAFAIVVSAQSTTTETTGATSASLTPAQSSQAACLEACAAGDVDCQARCIAVSTLPVKPSFPQRTQGRRGSYALRVPTSPARRSAGQRSNIPAGH